MKCVKCGTDSKYSERTNRTCPKCKQKFVFEPKNGDPVTDMLFQNAIHAVSGAGRLRWGAENLYYEICRRKKPSARATPLFVKCLIALVAVVMIAIALPRLEVIIPSAVGLAVVVLIWASVSSMRQPTVSMPKDRFSDLLARWQAVHKTPGMIVRRAQPATAPDLEADIGDYSFDRAVVCDRARTVDLLVANNFHFENNCAILSVDGYPKGPFQTIKAMLKRNPKLQVFVLHDATVEGCRLAHQIATDPNWFDGQLRVIDLGLRPNHAKPFDGLLLPADTGRVDPIDGVLTVAEANWLSKYTLELAAIRPEQIVKRLFRGLNAHKNDSTTPDSGGNVMYCTAFDTASSGESGGVAGETAADSGGDNDDGGADAFG